jgi:CHAT domain-containing protein/tetratricopeptide (TPR) repeat protein
LQRALLSAAFLVFSGVLAAQPQPAALNAELDARYDTLLGEWQRQRDPKAIEAPVVQLLTEQRAALGAQAVPTLLTTRMLADVRYDRGDLDGAMALIEESISGLTTAKGAADTDTLLARLVRVKVLRDRARWREAALECEAVLDLSRGSPDRRAWRRAQVELVYMYDKIGRLGDAIAVGEQALREGSADAGDVDSALLLDRLAGVYLELGRTEEAAEMQQRAQDAYVANFGPDHEATLSAASNLATTLWEVGRREEVIELERDTVRRRQAIADLRPRNALITRNLLAEHLLLLGRLDESEQEFRAVLPRWIEKFGARDPDAIDVRYFLARIAVERGELELARAEFEEVCRTYEDIGDTYEGAPQHCRERLAGVLWRLGRRDQALQMLSASLGGFEQRIETGRLSDRSQQTAFAGRVPAFRQWVEWLLIQGDANAAFSVSERLRARTLLQSIVLRHADASPALPAGDAARLGEMKARLATLDDLISQEADPRQRALLGAERDATFRELVDLRAELGRRFPAYASLSSVRTVTPAEAARLLRADSVAVTYLLGETRLYALVTSPRQPLSTVDLGPVQGLGELVEAAQVLLGRDSAQRVWRNPDGRLVVAAVAPATAAVEVTDWREVVGELGRRLVAPLAPHLRGYRRLIVVPDGPLALLPFEVLELKGKPLVATLDVSYVQSLSVLAAMRTRPPHGSRGAVLSVGAPDFSQPGRERSGTPERRDVASIVRGLEDSSLAGRRAYDLLQLQWSPLPGAQAEIASVQKVFGAAADSRALTGRDASEPALQGLERSGALARFRYVHFATHAYLSPTVPAMSAIVLSPTDIGPGADGYLTAAELPGYHFNSDLIVVSACETGRGPELAGEGIMGLPYALFVSGNRSAMMTLWKTADDSTARFVSRFFTRVAAGEAPTAALAAVKREFLRVPRLAAPMHWAGFVLYGPP